MRFLPQSEMMESELLRWKILRRTTAIIYIILNSVYMVYRFTIINPNSLFLSWFYFIAETFQFILGLNLIFSSWHYKRRKSPPPLKNVSVEVWVPVYLEPIEIIRRTLSAAKRIDYPHETWVLDDGKRPEIRELADELGIIYLSRKDNLNAKAGNLNFALSQSKADFIMAFDADHIPLPSAIDSMIGFFSDPKVALVQSPQDYYNTDAFQYFNSKKTGAIWHDQSFFYLLAQPAMDHAGSATCVGTGVIYRRSALLEINGIPEDTATEDIHTSLKLMKHGWKTVFFHEPIAYGIAASNLEEYYKTRHRWAHGNLHALALEKIPFTQGMTWRQRFHHLSLGLIYLEGWQQFMLFMIPIIALLTGWQPFIITPLNVLIILFYPLISILLLQELGCGYSRIWANELFSMARWPVHLVSSIGIFKRKILWKTSSKILQTQTSFSRVIPQLTIFILSAIALSVATATLIHHFDEGVMFSGKSINFTAPLEKGFTVDILIVAGGWAIYNMIRVVFFLKKAYAKSNENQDYRFPIHLPIALDGNNGELNWGKTICISESQVRISINNYSQDMAAGDRVAISLPLPTGLVEAYLHIENIEGKKDGHRLEISGTLEFTNPKSAEYLIHALYSVFWYRDLRSNRPAFQTPLGWIWRLITGKAFQKYKILDEFVVLKNEDSSYFAIFHHEEASPMVTMYEEFNPGTELIMLRIHNESLEKRRITICSVEENQSLRRVGDIGKRAVRYKISPMEELDIAAVEQMEITEPR